MTASLCLFLLAARPARAADFETQAGRDGAKAVAAIAQMRGESRAGQARRAAAAAAAREKTVTLRCFPQVSRENPTSSDSFFFWAGGDIDPDVNEHGQLYPGFTVDLGRFPAGPGKAGHFGRGLAMKTADRDPVQVMIDVIVYPEYKGDVAARQLDGFSLEVRQVKQAKKDVPFETRQKMFADPEIYARSIRIRMDAAKGDFTLDLPSHAEGVGFITVGCLVK